MFKEKWDAEEFERGRDWAVGVLYAGGREKDALISYELNMDTPYHRGVADAIRMVTRNSTLTSASKVPDER